MTPHSNHSVEIDPAAPKPPTGERSKAGRTVRVLLGLLALALVLIPLWRNLSGKPERTPQSGPGGAGDDKAAGAGKGERKPSVRVVTLEPRPFSVVLEGLGTVTPLATVTVKSQVDGPLLSVHYQEGGAVRRGQLLAEIDPRPYRIKLAQARAATDRDKATLKNAQLDLSRYQSLVEQKLIAQQQLDAQRSQVDQLTATVESDDAAADDAALQLAYTRIQSPIDGVAGIRQVDPGNLVRATDTGGIVVLTQLDPIAVIFTLPQDDLPRLAAAMDETNRKVVAQSRAGDENLAEGKLTVIDNQINTQTASVRLKAQFDNPARKLWPNQFVRARIEVSHQDAALVLPAAAIQQGPTGSYVYVLTPDNIAHMRPVHVALLQGEEALVDKGVARGDRVVVEGQEQIKPDSAVTPREVGEKTAAGVAPGGGKRRRDAGSKAPEAQGAP